jgi:hypothetical protein
MRVKLIIIILLSLVNLIISQYYSPIPHLSFEDAQLTPNFNFLEQTTDIKNEFIFSNTNHII